ncbi:MAG: UbiA family prenyltransferase [Planctomycetota bacterium]|nr:UbiA family prenyltransferase [Planctomycetota bacterium]
MSDPAAPPAAPDPVVGFGQLLRIALFPSAIADVLVGLSLAHLGGVPSRPAVWLLVPASLGVYHGAMALNDWADRRVDAAERPERPIPSGAIPAGVAFGIAMLLMLGGVMWAAAAGPRAGLWMAAVALLAALYDVAGRGPLRGPLLLGLCRAGNLGAGLLSPWLVGAEPRLSPVLVGALMLVYGLHVASISSLGRLEDGEDDEPLGTRPTRFLTGAALTSSLLGLTALIVLLIAPAHALPDILTGAGDAANFTAAAVLAIWNGRVLLGAAREMEAKGWTRALVGAATGLCLRRLPWTLAGLAVIAADEGRVGLGAFVFCLAGGYVSKALRKRFPLT